MVNNNIVGKVTVVKLGWREDMAAALVLLFQHRMLLELAAIVKEL